MKKKTGLELARYELSKKGLSFFDVDRKHTLREGAVRLALSYPNSKVEKILAEELGVSIQDLFPKRYDKDGVRYKPQPKENYKYGSELRNA
jgi:lambda repressor-like predicted transcriptional regulator